MAAKSKKNSRTATAIKKSESEKQAARQHAMSPGRRQMTAVILFAVAVFLLFVTVIKGEKAWLWMHNTLFGLFGICAYIWPIVLGLIAVLAALDKLYGAVYAKIIEGSVTVVLIGAAVDIFSGLALNNGFAGHIKQCFKLGVSWKNGGFFGALIGHPLTVMFGHTGAIITVILLIFVFVMLITGTTLVSFFRTVAAPVRKLEQHTEQAFEHQEAGSADDADQTAGRKRRFNGNVEMDGDTKPAEPPMTDKQKNLIKLYGGETPTGDGEEDGGTVSSRGAEATDEEDTENAARIVSDEQSDPVLEGVNKSIENTNEKIRVLGAAQTDDSPDKNSYSFPPIDLLEKIPPRDERSLKKEQEETAARLIDTLHSFGLESRIINICRGPAVTRYELQPSAGVRINRFTQLSEEIAMNLATTGVRIAPIPNKTAIGFEVPNRTVSTVGIRELIESAEFSNAKSRLTVCLGKDIAGNSIVTDIAKMPHGLIAGATGSGKSVCINSIIMSLLYKATPDEVKLLMIDPKVVELGVYNGIPHLLVPVVTEPRKAAGALGWAVNEMEKRYRMFAENEVRNLKGYNRLADQREDMPRMPHIVIIVDELADLMMTAPKEVEDYINRIAAKARAAGMHLILATQRPSVNVVTGVIKNNIPTRIAFAVSSQVDSRTILDSGGADKLIGRGDMLFKSADSQKPLRVQGCFVSDEEVETVVEYIKGNAQHEYDSDVAEEIERNAVKEKSAKDSDDEEDETDSMFTQAVEYVIEAGQASTSMLQRRLRLGYARAGRIIDDMERKGIISSADGSKPRQVQLSEAQNWLDTHR